MFKKVLEYLRYPKLLSLNRGLLLKIIPILIYHLGLQGVLNQHWYIILNKLKPKEESSLKAVKPDAQTGECQLSVRHNNKICKWF
jgi:hypothetical protein